MPRALVIGVSGQDGTYLAQWLLQQGYQVVGTSRDAEVMRFDNLQALGLASKIQLESLAINDFRSVLQLISRVEPDEIYNLAGQSSVALSFQQPAETLESIALAALNILEAIRFIDRPIRFYNASSSECFGDTGSHPASEETPFRPRSPYAVAKASAFWQVANYREAYGIHACSGILFNHESPIRPRRFVTAKVIAGACAIARGGKEKLHLGNLRVQRDWGWAPEYVQAMWRMLQVDRAEDFVIATGETNSLEDFVRATFEALGLNWQKHVDSDPSLLRPTDISIGRANPAKAAEKLGWRAQLRMRDVVKRMVEHELNRLGKVC